MSKLIDKVDQLTDLIKEDFELSNVTIVFMPSLDEPQPNQIMNWQFNLSSSIIDSINSLGILKYAIYECSFVSLKPIKEKNGKLIVDLYLRYKLKEDGMVKHLNLNKGYFYSIPKQKWYRLNKKLNNFINEK